MEFSLKLIVGSPLINVRNIVELANRADRPSFSTTFDAAVNSHHPFVSFLGECMNMNCMDSNACPACTFV